MRYSRAFERDVRWYLSVRHRYAFAGKNIDVASDRNGCDGILAFHRLDSTGKAEPTRHPRLLRRLLTIKASVNLHLKMFAEDLVSGLLFRHELEEHASQIQAPEWFVKAAEQQAEAIIKRAERKTA